jgi:hypothetical protein
MNISPRLVLDHRHLIISNNNVPCYMNNIFNCSEGNVMHNFYNVPFCCVAPIFFWNVFHLQEPKQKLESFKVNEWLTLSQKTKKTTNSILFPPHPPHPTNLPLCLEGFAHSWHAITL